MSLFDKIVICIGLMLMTKNQRLWLGRLYEYDKWQRHNGRWFSDTVIYVDGSTTYLNEGAIVIRDRGGEKVCSFSPDWLGIREKACLRLKAKLDI